MSLYISISFILVTGITVGFLQWAGPFSKKAHLFIAFWAVLQSALALQGFYLNTESIPPRLIFALGPALLIVFGMFVSKVGHGYIMNLDLRKLTLLHTIRVPVELILFGLFMEGLIPELMTFEGRNFDILAGLTAPVVYFLGFKNSKPRRKLLLFWNGACTLLLLNIVIHAILATPFPFQQLAFDQPNVAVLQFPIIWLPTIVVPIVLFAHVVTLYRLFKSNR